MKKEPNHKKVFLLEIPQEYYNFKDYVDTNANTSLKKSNVTKPAKAKPSNATKPAKPKSPSTKHVKKLSKKRVVGAIKSSPRPPLREINEGNVDHPKRAIKRKKLSI